VVDRGQWRLTGASDSIGFRERGTCGGFGAGCLSLIGCAEYKAKLAAERAAVDDAKCQSYGAKPGDPAYVQCRAQLDAARTLATATENSGGAAQPVKPVDIPTPRTQPWGLPRAP
jgi:hypothetical protein